MPILWPNNNFLEKCYQLKELGYFPDPLPMQMWGRGFSDLGFESFLYLPNSSLLSLFTGQTSKLNKDNLSHFFHIPTTDEAFSWLQSKKVIFKNIKYDNTKDLWSLTIIFKNKAIELYQPTLNELAIKGMQFVLKGKNNNA